MTFMSKKVAVAGVAGVLTIGLLGSSAVGAFAPVTHDPASLEQGQLGASSQERGHPDKLKEILDGLVKKGVITQAQEDAILAALKDAAGKHDRDALRRIYADLMEQSAKYLGLSMADLKTKLPGSSLAAIANGTTGKSRDGLVAFLNDATAAAIDKAFVEGKITKEQADKAKAEAPKRVAEFVDHTYPQRPTAAGTRPASVTSFIGDVFAVARDYTGLSQQDLMKGLRDGKSLGEIASGVAGKTRDGLVAAITNAANLKIDKARADGKITLDQATALKTRVGTAVTQIVDRKGHGNPKH